MMFGGCFSPLLLWCVILLGGTLCHHVANKTEISPRSAKREKLEQQALAAYNNTCHRLQDLANWMAIALRIKSIWARSNSIKKQKRLNIEINDSTSIYDRTASHQTDPSADNSCASFKNLQSNAQTFVKWQSELLKAKVLTGGHAIKNSLARLNDSEIVKNAQSILNNKTSNEFLQTLKMGSQVLLMLLEDERNRTMTMIQEAGRASDFLGYLSSMRNNIMNQLQTFAETSEGMRRFQSFLQYGELLNLLRNTLEAQPESNNQSDIANEGDLIEEDTETAMQRG